MAGHGLPLAAEGIDDGNQAGKQIEATAQEEVLCLSADSAAQVGDDHTAAEHDNHDVDGKVDKGESALSNSRIHGLVDVHPDFGLVLLDRHRLAGRCCGLARTNLLSGNGLLVGIAGNGLFAWAPRTSRLTRSWRAGRLIDLSGFARLDALFRAGRLSDLDRIDRLVRSDLGLGRSNRLLGSVGNTSYRPRLLRNSRPLGMADGLAESCGLTCSTDDRRPGCMGTAGGACITRVQVLLGRAGDRRRLLLRGLVIGLVRTCSFLP